MTVNDQTRGRKTYSFFRAPPVAAASTLISGSGGITVTGDKTQITITGDPIGIGQTLGVPTSVKSYGATGNGVTNDFATIQTAFATAADLYYSPGTYRISTTGIVGLSSSMHRFESGGMLSVDSGKTLTLHGTIDSGRYQIFSGSGTVLLPDVHEIVPEWFGTVGNANYLHTDFHWYTDSSHTTEATDDSAALTAAINSIATRSTAGQDTVVRLSGFHYLKTPGSATGPFNLRPFITVPSNTTISGDNNNNGVRIGPALQNQEYCVFYSADNSLHNVTIEGVNVDGNAQSTPTATTNRNPVVAFLGSGSSNITLRNNLINNHGGTLVFIVADFNSVTQNGRTQNFIAEGNSFVECGDVVGLVDHVEIYCNVDGASIVGNNWFNDPATNANSRNNGNGIQIQGNGAVITGNSFVNVANPILLAAINGIPLRGMVVSSNTMDLCSAGIAFAVGAGLRCSEITIVGNSFLICNDSQGQIESAIQCIQPNGNDLGVEFVFVGNRCRYVHDARYSDTQPSAITFSTNIRAALIADNDFDGWTNAGIVISPVTFTTVNDSPGVAVASADLKLWDLKILNNRFANCAISASTINLVCDSTNTPIRRLEIRGNSISSHERLLRLSNATNTSPIVCTTVDEVTSIALAHGLADGNAVTIGGVKGNTAANTAGYAKRTGYSTTTFGLYSDAGLTMPVAGNGAYTHGGVVQVPNSGSITNGIIVSGAGDQIDVDPSAQRFDNVTTPLTITPSVNGMTNVFAGARSVTIDDGTNHAANITYDHSALTNTAGTFRISKPIALANNQYFYGINAAGTTAYGLFGLDVNDFVRISAQARLVAIGPIVTATNAVPNDLLLCKSGGAIRRENNAQSAALLLLDSDSSDYARLGFDSNVAGGKMYASGNLALQVDTDLSLPRAANIKIGGSSNVALNLSSGFIQVGFDNGLSGVKIYNGAAGNYALVADSTGTSIQHGGSTRIKADGTGLGFFAASPVAKPSITGALLSVTDANAKAVMTSIINAIANLGLATNSTT